MEEGLVIKSDKEWIQYFRSRVSGIIPFMLMEIVVVIAFNYDLRKRNSVIPEIADVFGEMYNSGIYNSKYIFDIKYLSNVEGYRTRTNNR